MTVSINPDKTLNMNGAKIFPVGLHQFCSQDTTAGACEPSINAEFTQKAGPTFGPVGGDWWIENIPKLEALGIGWYSYVTSHGTLPERWKNSPTFIGYYQPDEPNPGNPSNLFPSTMTLEEVIAKVNGYYDEMKRNDPSHLVILGHWEQMLRWAPYCDILAWDTYTIAEYQYYTREDSIYAYEQWSEQNFFKGNNLNSISKPVWAIIQANGVDVSPMSGFLMKVPTYKEAKCNTWTAITMDVKGINFWTYHHRFSNIKEIGLDQNPVAHANYKQIAAELRMLNDILVLPTVDYSWQYHPGTTVMFDKMLTKYVLWKDRTNFNYIVKQKVNEVYVIIVNKDSRLISDVKITISGLTGIMTAKTLGLETIGSGRAGRMLSVNNGQFTDNFDGYAVHIYKISEEIPECQKPLIGFKAQ